MTVGNVPKSAEVGRGGPTFTIVGIEDMDVIRSTSSDFGRQELPLTFVITRLSAYRVSKSSRLQAWVVPKKTLLCKKHYLRRFTPRNGVPNTSRFYSRICDVGNTNSGYVGRAMEDVRLEKRG